MICGSVICCAWNIPNCEDAPIWIALLHAVLSGSEKLIAPLVDPYCIWGPPVKNCPPCEPDAFFNEKRCFCISDFVFKSPKLVCQRIVHQTFVHQARIRQKLLVKILEKLGSFFAILKIRCIYKDVGRKGIRLEGRSSLV